MKSGFRVKDKEGIEYPKSSLKMLIFPSNGQFGSKFWIKPDEDDVFLVNTFQMQSGDENGTLNLWTFEPVNAYDELRYMLLLFRTDNYWDYVDLISCLIKTA